MIPVMLRGDTPHPVRITVAEDLAVLQVSYQGVMVGVDDVSAGDTVDVPFTREVVSQFELGTYPLVCVGAKADGTVKTYPISQKLKITDCPGEVYETPPIDLGHGCIVVNDLTGADSMAHVKTVVNRILEYLRCGVSCLAFASVLSAFAVEPLYTTLNDLPGDALVMTNVAEYVQANAGSGGGGAVSSVNGKTGAVVLTGLDIKRDDDPDSLSVFGAIASNARDIAEHIEDTDNPHHVNAADVGAYTTNETLSVVAAATNAIPRINESESAPGWAANADFATYSSQAENSYFAISADNDGAGNLISGTYARKDEMPSLSGQTFDFADNRVLYTALSNIIIRLGGTVTNFPAFN